MGILSESWGYEPTIRDVRPKIIINRDYFSPFGYRYILKYIVDKKFSELKSWLTNLFVTELNNPYNWPTQWEETDKYISVVLKPNKYTHINIIKIVYVNTEQSRTGQGV